MVEWRANDEVIVLNSDPPRSGVPCGDDFIQTTDLPEIDDEHVSISPDGRFEVKMVIVNNETSLYEASMIEVQTGQLLTQVDFLGDAYFQWITEDKFLVSHTVDQGPLLIEVRKEIVRVTSDLFGLPVCRGEPCQNSDQATAQVVRDTSTYHILLESKGDTPEADKLLLYHPEDGQIEELSARRLWWPGFSPDGKWLILDEGGGGNAVWIRPVDPLGSDLYIFAKDVNNLIWSPDGSKVAFRSRDHRNVRVFSFPDGNEIGFWNLGKYEVNTILWSPDGKFISVFGYLGNQENALFLIEVP
jgi:WD40 repeat protein